MPDDQPTTQGGGTAALSPKDIAAGRVKPGDGPSDRPGTEAEEAVAARGGHEPDLPGEGPGQAGEEAASYRENDA